MAMFELSRMRRPNFRVSLMVVLQPFLVYAVPRGEPFSLYDSVVDKFARNLARMAMICCICALEVSEAKTCHNVLKRDILLVGLNESVVQAKTAQDSIFR